MEWFFYNNKDRATKGCLVMFVLPFIVLVVVLLCMRRTKPLTPAPKVKLDQDEVCIDIRSNILYDELTNHEASEYFELSQPNLIFGGSFDIKCKESELAKQKFNSIFLADSAAYYMDKEYHHLFQLDEKNKRVSLDTHSGGKYTTVPAWLIVRLVEEGLLTIPQN